MKTNERIFPVCERVRKVMKIRNMTDNCGRALPLCAEKQREIPRRGKANRGAQTALRSG
jgi:hypothetical protein